MPEQLFHSDLIGTDGEEYITCSDCLQLGVIEDYPLNYCDIIKGRVVEPERSWCTIGLASAWMKMQPLNKVIEFLSMV